MTESPNLRVLIVRPRAPMNGIRSTGHGGNVESTPPNGRREQPARWPLTWSIAFVAVTSLALWAGVAAAVAALLA